MNKDTQDLDKAIKAELTKDDSLKTKPTMAEQLRKHRDGYETTSTNDRLSCDNGDDVATMLRGLTPLAIVKAAEILCGMKEGELQERYAKLNNGQRRMNAGNRIRGLIKKGKKSVDEVKSALTH